jgi:uncharacterized damage-inducible protein DinB
VSPGLGFSELIAYTDWLRDKWHDWLCLEGDDVLATSVGPHGDGRFETIGDLVRHIFSAEKRYIERLSNRPLTDAASVANNKVEALFDFGRQSRKDLKEFIAAFPAADWDLPQDFTLMNKALRITARKTVAHVLMHEIRHWAQIATLLRLQGLAVELHDLLFSPVLGGEFGPLTK